MATVVDRDRWAPAFVAAAREWLARGEPAWLPIAGDSMTPTLRRGARVLVVGVNAAEVRAGDLVLYATEDTLVCHRVLRRRAEHLLTRGDAWRGIAVWVPQADVMGRVVATEHGGVLRPLDSAAARHAARLWVVRSLALDRIVAVARGLRWRLERAWP